MDRMRAPKSTTRLPSIRQTRGPDTRGMQAAVAGPGIDPRIWLSYAYITEVQMDEQNGLLCNLTLVPSGQPETAQLGGDLAGEGAGDYAPVAVNDIVLVAVPMGDVNEGPVIIRKLWTPSEIPSPAMLAHPEEPSLTLPAGKSKRYVATEGGRWIFVPGDTGFVELGQESPENFAALANLVFAELEKIQTALSGHTHGPGSFNVAAAPGPVAGLSAPSSTFTPESVAAEKVKIK